MTQTLKVRVRIVRDIAQELREILRTNKLFLQIRGGQTAVASRQHGHISQLYTPHVCIAVVLNVTCVSGF
jgi:hypothetical protein